jgi:hypothetical protein
MLKAMKNAEVALSQYYKKMDKKQGQLLLLAAYLDPYNKLKMFKKWDNIEGRRLTDANSFTQMSRKAFINY